MLIRSAEPLISFNPTINELIYDTDYLKNNIPLYGIQDKSQAVCGVEIVFGGGKVEENSNGAAYFSTSLLKSGIKGYNSNQINNFFELRGAFVQLQSGLDFNTISLYCLTSKLAETLPFFLSLFTEPIFPNSKLLQLKTKKLQELEINEQKSSYWASKLFREALFNKHPYAQALTKTDFQSITSQQLKDHWSTNVLSNINFITIAGNFDKLKVISEIENTFEVQPLTLTKNSSGLSLPKNNPSLLRKTLEKSTQSSLRIGLHTIDLTDNNYPALSLGNTLLGGYFGSRLMQSIREEKGLTYGIGSSIRHLNHASYFQINADVKMGAGEEVIELIEIELNKLVSIQITDNELSKVKSYIIGEYKSNSETIFDKISKVKFLKLKNLADSYFITHFESILALQQSTVQEALKNHFDSNNFSSILVE